MDVRIPTTSVQRCYWDVAVRRHGRHRRRRAMFAKPREKEHQSREIKAKVIRLSQLMTPLPEQVWRWLCLGFLVRDVFFVVVG